MNEAMTASLSAPGMVYHAPRLEECVERLVELHPRLCPRQVLGVRIGLQAGLLLGLDLPQPDKRLLTLVETDGCFADGVSVATGCWLGRRTLRLLDFGKVAATFVDLREGRAIRVWPCAGIRERARAYASSACDRWHAQLEGYQAMPTDELLRWRRVSMADRLDVLGQPGGHVTCIACGEEVLNGRELVLGRQVLCRPCGERGVGFR